MKKLKYQIDPSDLQHFSAEVKNSFCVYDLIDSGYESVEKGDYETALVKFSEGASINNTDTEILNGIGLCLCELGRSDEAKTILHRARRLDPDDPIACANLAGVYWDLEDFDSAIYYYNLSIEMNPAFEDIHFNLINLYMEIGYCYMAYSLALKAKQLFPDDEEIEELINDIILNMAIMNY